MKISKSSWHARFYYGIDAGLKTSLCNYFAVVVSNILDYIFNQVMKLSFYLVGLCVVSTSLYLAYQNPIEALKLVGLLVAIILTLVLIFLAIIFWELVFGSGEPRPNTIFAKIRNTLRPPVVRVTSGVSSFTSLIYEYLKAKKQNICPPIEFVD